MLFSGAFCIAWCLVCMEVLRLEATLRFYKDSGFGSLRNYDETRVFSTHPGKQEACHEGCMDPAPLQCRCRCLHGWVVQRWTVMPASIPQIRNLRAASWPKTFCKKIGRFTSYTPRISQTPFLSFSRWVFLGILPCFALLAGCIPATANN